MSYIVVRNGFDFGTKAYRVVTKGEAERLHMALENETGRVWMVYFDPSDEPIDEATNPPPASDENAGKSFVAAKRV